MGVAPIRTRGWWREPSPLLYELADRFNESVTLSVANAEGGIDLVAEATGPHVLGVLGHNMVGQRYPLHASSTGKVLLAELPPAKLRAALPDKLEAHTPHTITDHTLLLKELEQVREQGFAIIDNELEPELLSLSRPIRDSSGALVAILTVNGPRSRLAATRSRSPPADAAHHRPPDQRALERRGLSVRLRVGGHLVDRGCCFGECGQQRGGGGRIGRLAVGRRVDVGAIRASSVATMPLAGGRAGPARERSSRPARRRPAPA